MLGCKRINFSPKRSIQGARDMRFVGVTGSQSGLELLARFTRRGLQRVCLRSFLRAEVA
jgi:hypothetical protein